MCTEFKLLKVKVPIVFLGTVGFSLHADKTLISTPKIFIVYKECDFLYNLLALETLVLGHRMFLYKCKSSSISNFVAKLIPFEI